MLCHFFAGILTFRVRFQSRIDRDLIRSQVDLTVLFLEIHGLPGSGHSAVLIDLDKAAVLGVTVLTGANAAPAIHRAETAAMIFRFILFILSHSVISSVTDIFRILPALR